MIDADAFIEYLGLDAENSREDNLGEIVTLEDFDRQPAAYDVDKVVGQIKSLSPANYVEKNKVLEIVKAGGVNE